MRSQSFIALSLLLILFSLAPLSLAVELTDESTPVPTFTETSPPPEATEPPATVSPTLPTEVIEETQTTAPMDELAQIRDSVQRLEYTLNYISGFALFAVIVCLCFFSYKFFRIFF